MSVSAPNPPATPGQDPEHDGQGANLTIIEHIQELRNRLMICGATLTVAMIASFSVAGAAVCALLLLLIVASKVHNAAKRWGFILVLIAAAAGAAYSYTLVPDFWNAAKNTVLITLITVPGALVVGLGLAMLANLPFKRKWPVRLALLLPWALPLAFAGLIFAWFFHTEYGVVNDVVRRVAPPSEPAMWLLRPNWAFAAICATIVWKTSSFMALILLAGLQMIPKSLYEAAEVDGASKWQQFWQITIPMLMPSIIVALIFRTITALQT
jgi:multiple sugar transport system permease protein